MTTRYNKRGDVFLCVELHDFWDDNPQGSEVHDGFIAAVAEAITEDAARSCWHASRRRAMSEACWEKAGAFVHRQILWMKDGGVLTRTH